MEGRGRGVARETGCGWSWGPRCRRRVNARRHCSPPRRLMQETGHDHTLGATPVGLAARDVGADGARVRLAHGAVRHVLGRLVTQMPPSLSHAIVVLVDVVGVGVHGEVWVDHARPALVHGSLDEGLVVVPDELLRAAEDVGDAPQHLARVVLAGARRVRLHVPTGAACEERTTRCVGRGGGAGHARTGFTARAAGGCRGPRHLRGARCSRHCRGSPWASRSTPPA